MAQNNQISSSSVVSTFLANPSAYAHDFSESKFWSKIKRVFKRVGRAVIYNALLLYYVLLSPDVPKKHKSFIIAALGYFISPIDIFPDLLPGGYTDDIVILLTVIKIVACSITPEIREMADRKVQEWFSM